jgi:serine phosphatase RsbU (regulator of sigma subunit)/Tfp pilus assembly protein PilF
MFTPFMHIKYIAILILITFTTFGKLKADGVSDSLLLVLHKAGHDSIRLRINNELAAHFATAKPDTSKYFANQALKLSLQLLEKDELSVTKIKAWQAISYTTLGDCYKTLGEYDDAVNHYKKSLDLRNEVKDLKGMAQNYIHIGGIRLLKGIYDSAEDYFKKAIEIQEKINDEEGLARAYLNMGNVYYYQGETNLSVEYYQKSLVLSEKIGDLEGAAKCYNNIGMIYTERRYFNWALDYHGKSLAIKEKKGDKRGVAVSYNNLGDVYFAQKRYKEAKEHYNKSLDLRKAIKDKRGQAFSLQNIGRVFANEDKYLDAERYYQQSLKIFEEIADQEQKARLLTDIASINLKLNNYKKTIKYAQEAIEIGKQLKTLPRLRDAYEVLAKVYEKQNNIPNAYKYYKMFIATKDSIYRDEEHKLIEKETKYKVDKKQKEIENTNLKLEKQEADKRNMRMKMFLLLIGLGAMLVLAFVLFKNYKQKTKANKLLEEQKSEIELQKEQIELQRDLVMEKNEQVLAAKKEIEDSIIYAKNIQHAILPSEELLSSILPEHFIFFRPRNIVSGDFFWVRQLKNFVVVAIADCTGHGVPGAFMSMLGFMFLNETVTTRRLDNSGQILDRLREKIKESLHQSGKEGEAKDGMDISFFIIDTDNRELQFSGAFNPLYLIRDNDRITSIEAIENESIKSYVSPDDKIKATLFEIKADRQPIAIYSYEKPFKSHVLKLEPGDRIYSFTDGYPDQFGGDEGKKFNAKRFKEMFLNICHLPMDEQYEQVNKNFYDWMGNIEQVDDVLLMGLRIL